MLNTQIISERKPFAPGVCLLIGSSKLFWRVLEYAPEDDTALVTADRPIFGIPFNTDLRLVTWADCTLRAFLNGEFLEREFKAEERGAIATVHVSTANNPRYGTKGGADTEDKVFIPDVSEAERLFPDDAGKRAPYMWWLRSPGHGNRFFAIVDHYGTIRTLGSSVDSVSCSVRPMMRVKLSSPVFKDSLTRDADGRPAEVMEPQLLIEGSRLKAVRMLIEEALVPECVTEVEPECFSNCRALRSVSFLGDVDGIDETVFKDCPSISDVSMKPGVWERMPRQVKQQLVRRDVILSYLDGWEQFRPDMEACIKSLLNTAGIREQYIREQIQQDNSIRLGRLLDSLNEPLTADETSRYINMASNSAETKILLMDYKKRTFTPAKLEDEFDLSW